MALGNCTREIQDCDLGQVTFEQLFRKLLRVDGNCLYLNTGNNSYTTSDETNVSYNAANRSAVDTILSTFKSTYPDSTIIDRDIVWNGASYDVFIRYIP